MTAPQAESQTRSVVVGGDVTLDWNLARIHSPGPPRATWSVRDSAYLSCRPGGAALLAELISALSSSLRKTGIDVALQGPAVRGARPARPSDTRFHHSHATWARYPTREGSAWRVEEFLGVTRAADAAGAATRAVEDPDTADLVILDDADLGVRWQPDAWPRATATARWVLHKMDAPIASGALWDRLLDAPERLIVVTTIGDLRLSEVQISRELSWERTAQDLVWELVHNPRVNALSRCAHLVVSFDVAGAVLLSNGPRGPEATLVFDPATVEGGWERDNPGGMIGYTSCLVAGVARELLIAPHDPDLLSGIRRGLAAMRDLHLHGYAQQSRGSGVEMTFPAARVAEQIQRESTTHAVAAVPRPVAVMADGPTSEWTILQDRYTGGLETLAQRIALEGPDDTLEGVPLGRFGKLLTIDRREMEGYSSIRTLIREYAKQSRPKRPLSIAVFGPPGAGKSFGVVEVARSVLPDRIKVLTFNCSQLGGPGDLLGALHQVRDAALEGSLPLVFWDEFDSSLGAQTLGWLRYFLAPMQDGAFQEGQLVHPIGPSVFVFAGGTSETMRTFSAQTTDAFRHAKGPDFVSRLKGYVDVLGPNPRGGDTEDDRYYLIRRAVLLRTILRRDVPAVFHKRDGRDVLDIDTGVLRAFLLTRRYLHGARSLESIVATSVLSGMSRFERSSLPAEPQLELHVDAKEFLALVHRLDLDGPVLERLAEAAHVVWCAGMLEQGFDWGEPDDEYLTAYHLLAPFAGRRRDGKRHPNLVPFSHLPEPLRDESRALVRDIPNKLAAGGYVMRPARGKISPFALSGEDLEVLSEAEHERWMARKLDAKWRYGPVRDDAERLHPGILPWRKLSPDELTSQYGPFSDAIGDGELPEEEKEKDRELVRGIPRILAVAGYTVERLGS